ncbi:DNA-binding domain-containing protein, AraC-type [Sphaerochaeta pleomorpha str. Grapes]|uniref:DNA-binding domain-containing protein, AraC-type n=1 Tax=Sphaerochaeta pleomorpha (strain ATCC BAA-1885 / DSM 22778 / Grapes) TaxID=158190 RepID=G8QSC4_SPHPG|nr:helix-turn-helix domain-containing protein [Sphaerochaeta pleomorpha]AEV30054.1 DNA-binding domain-containing protein, AraC-type [Sphaerochaeta pleomorpha str. Grapes]
MSSYRKITSYIEHLKTTYSLDVTIKDYSGFIYTDENLERVLRPYLAHSSPYCMFIKETREGYQRCLAQNKPLYERCKARKPFVGYCPAGICELVIPIANKAQVFGSINVSHFALGGNKGIEKRESWLQGAPEQRKLTAKFLYEQFVRPATIEVPEVQYSLELLAEYIAEIVKNAKNPVKDLKAGIEEEAKIRTFIAENANEKILVEQVLTSCNISKTSLYNLIEATNAKNFREYVNVIRIEQSEKLLLETGQHPKEVALKLGFKDYNHFCRLFKDQVKITPTDYQKYYKDEKHQATN